MGGDSSSFLEMRCSADEAWYDGTLSFASDTKDMIVVHFNDFDEEEDETFSASYLLDPKKLKARVRVRSQQLQDSQCRLVNENQDICGCLDDGADRRYYDARVVSIVKNKHSFNDDGEDCKCNFRLLWLDGPKKDKQTVVGCAEVCFLSIDAPEDDPMVKDLVKSLAGNGEQRRKPAAPKTLPSPRPRTPSPSLEIAPSKKQASKDASPEGLELSSWKELSSSKGHPPPSTLLDQRVQLGHQASAKSVGSKKKRIMQTEVTEQPDLASDNDNLNNLDTNARHSPEDRSCEGSGDVRGHSNESDDSERRGGGGESTKKGFMPVEKKRLVKMKASKAAVVPAPEVDVCEEDAVRANDKSISFRERLKLNKKKAATYPSAVRDEAAAVRQEDDIPHPVNKRMKSNTTNMATPDVAAPCEETAVVRKDYPDVVLRPFKWRVKFNAPEKKTTPDDAADREEAAPVREDDTPHCSFKERETSNPKSLATPDLGVAREEAAPVREDDTPHSSFKERETSNPQNLATPDVGAACDEAISLTCGERVKLKSLQKSKSVEASPQKKSEVASHKKKSEVASQKKKPEVASQKKKSEVASQKKKPEVIPQMRRPAAHKASLQNAGMQVVERQMENNLKQVQRETRLSSKLDEATRPGTLSRPNDVAAVEPKELLQKPKEQQKQKAARPKKRPLSKPVKQSLPSKEQPVRRCTKAQMQISQQEEIIDTANSKKQTSNPASKKKQRLEEPSAAIPNTDDIPSGQSTKEGDENLDKPEHVTNQARGNTERKTNLPLERELLQPPQTGDEALSEKSKSEDNDEDHTPCIKNTKRPWQPHQTELDNSAGAHTNDNEDDIPVATFANSKRLVKKSIAETCHDIDVRYGSNRQQLREHSVEKTSEAIEAITRGSSEELVASPPRVLNQIQENVPVIEVRETKAQTEIHASGKKRRRNLVFTDDEDEGDMQAPAKNLKNVNKKGKEFLHGSINSSANSQDDCGDAKTTSTSALDEEAVVKKQRTVDATTRLLLLSNMETDVSAYDAMLLLQKHTEGVCAVHVLPVPDFQSSTVGYALYRDSGSALKALLHLSSDDRFVVSPKGRPWIVTLSTNLYGPHMCGFAARTAYKSDDTGVWGIISDQPPIQDLVVVTKERDSQAYSQALQRSETYAEHQKRLKALHDQTVLDEIKA